MATKGKPSILVVDDDAGICETMADILGEMNYTVNTATDGYKALELVKGHEFTLTLMDMRMPGLDGLETLKRVRQVRPSMKVVMITAYAHDETVNELKKVGVEAILSKPIKFAELFEYLPLNSWYLRKTKRDLAKNTMSLYPRKLPCHWWNRSEVQHQSYFLPILPAQKFGW